MNSAYSVIQSFDPIQSNYYSVATYDHVGIKQMISDQIMIPEYLYLIRQAFYEHGLYNAIPFIMSADHGHFVCYRVDYYYPLQKIENEMSVYCNVPIGSIYKPILFSNEPISSLSNMIH
jgi:hypothetical protein